MNCAECGCPTSDQLYITGLGTLCMACMAMLTAVLTPWFHMAHAEWVRERSRHQELANGSE